MMHSDMVAMMAQQHSQALVQEAQRYRVSRPGAAVPRMRRRAWPWQRWELRSPIVRRACWLDQLDHSSV